MLNFLYNIPNLLLFICISIIFMGIGLLSIHFIHRKVPLKFRYEENQAITCVSALLGIIYAILIGFIILYELNNFNTAIDAEREEAKALFSIFRYAHALPKESATKIRSLVVDYANNTIFNEWPMMMKGKPVSTTGVDIIENISNEIRAFNSQLITNPIQVEALNNISTNTNALFDDHEERVSRQHNTLSSNIWFVLMLGTFLTIVINCILGMEFRLHILSITFISLMLAAAFYLVITLDKPYRGDFAIKPTRFIATLEYIKHKSIKI